MAFNLQNLLKSCNPNPEKAGKTLLVLNALGMLFAAASNTVAAAIDKNTSAEDKKFLVPAGAVTGVANIGLYYLMTDKIIKGLKESAKKTVEKMDGKELTEKATTLAKNMVNKAEKTLFKGKDHANYVANMKQNLFQNGNVENGITALAKQTYKDKTIASAGVLGAFIGAVVGCAILTPIIRDVSAYFVQKKMEKNNPNMENEPHRPYFDPTHLKINGMARPMSMTNYMAYTHNGKMKI